MPGHPPGGGTTAGSRPTDEHASLSRRSPSLRSPFSPQVLRSRGRAYVALVAALVLVGCTDVATPSASPRAATSASPAASHPAVAPSPSAGPPVVGRPFPGAILIADRGNGRIVLVDGAGHVLWRFPIAGSLTAGETFSADDAFLAPDGKTITANEEGREVVVRIDVATKRIVWVYGHNGMAGSADGYLRTPDDAYPLANGDVVIADIMNCRVIEVSPDKRIVRQWGRTTVCRHDPPNTYAQPNGDTPLPDGGLLITEIFGSQVVRLDAAGKVVFDVHVPTVYPSDAQLDADGNVVVADYANPGAVVSVDPSGKLLWRYGPTTGGGRLDHPSLAVPRADGTVLVNDDGRQRVVLIDPKAGRILWQYGQTDVPGTGPDQLSDPDGLNEVSPAMLSGFGVTVPGT